MGKCIFELFYDFAQILTPFFSDYLLPVCIQPFCCCDNSRSFSLSTDLSAFGPYKRWKYHV